MSSSHERYVPILRSANSLIEQEFDSIREKFEAEMLKMEEEMSRFRSQLIATELGSSAAAAGIKSTSSKTTKTVKQSTTTRIVGGQSAAHRGEPSREKPSRWLEELDSPLIKEDSEGSGGKMLKLRFDVTAYAPEQIVVKTVDDRLRIHAKREERSENMSMYKEYNREFLLPKGVDVESIRSSLSADGVLTVEAPLPSLTSNEIINL